ncbi:zinc metalloprotease [Nocardioides mangrovicus]|uniref:Zinc metalloprotease n=1 Tax=Nocardioides mangrovicus TaxID=2478913 RepID=A0A3L8P314_9ACTN|nr:zinc metalloprotease [Nocardioides mangrovicus]RLV49806.1 zinc metalloprotease [Nocardioides mangrovicus]
MTTTRTRAVALASLLLGAGGLAGLSVPSAQAAQPASARAHQQATAKATKPGDRLLTPADEGRISAATARQVQGVLTSKATQRAVAAHRGGGVIKVRAHIIVGTKKRDRHRHATKRQVRQQVKWLNLAYAGGEGPGVDTGVRFRLRSISTTKSKRWAHLRTVGQLNSMKKKLHRGGRNTLNLYFTGLPGGLLGISTFPWQNRGKRGKLLDGSVIQYSSIRGGKLAPYNEGDTVVHEVGHWLGLLHTFQGYDGNAGSGCAEPNDYVGDTPAEGEPQYQPAERDTCPAAGTDPVHNFMDYAPDYFMYQFTAGQAARISAARAAYRAS